MPSFCAVDYSNCTDREKDKSNYCFPSIVKINSEKGLKLSKVRREKWLAQIFRKDLRIKRTRTRIEIILSASPLEFFPHKVYNIRFVKEIRILS